MVDLVEKDSLKAGYYFGAGPTMLPAPVHRAFRDSRLMVDGCHLKLYELSHRHPLAIKRIQEILKSMRNLLKIPDDYEVLLCAGGARHQYELVASNFNSKKFEFGISGCWSRSWFETTKRMMSNQVHAIQIDSETVDDFFHRASGNDVLRCIVTNETVDGQMLSHAHQGHGNKVIADVTSDLGFRNVPIQNYAMLFAATGKAFGVSGMTIVIIRKSMLKEAGENLPPLQSYAAIAKHQSMYATPSLICIDMLGHMVDWMIEQGGVEHIEQRQKKRSDRIYQIVDRKEIFTTKRPVEFRSMHNVCFAIDDDQERFFKCAQDRGIIGLRGHKLVGGARICLTHGITDQAFDVLCQFLTDYKEAK